ncbi:MAG: nuclear transport factor 2 family protein [Bacteroidota bacterium]
MTLRDKTKDIYSLIGQGQLLEAFDKYYGEDVVMTEPRGTREGKSTCRQYEEQFLSSVQEFHGLEVKSIAADQQDDDNGMVFHETSMDVTFKDGNRVQMDQVGVQKWENGHIVHERFYYQG